MPAARKWTEAEDDLIRSGASFPTIARQLGLHRWTVRERARLLQEAGEAIPPRPSHWRASVAPPHVVAHDDSRTPLPVGHPVSWDAIVAGTCLDGLGFPHQ